MAYEYHWYLRQEFRASLESTYRSPDSSRSKNRIWLCKLMAVLALGESFNSYEPPIMTLSQNTELSSEEGRSKGSQVSYLPGVRFFENALMLFKMPSEEPDIEHVEALNLIVSSRYHDSQLTETLTLMSPSSATL
jgi:proline utilization trans-activator